MKERVVRVLQAAVDEATNEEMKEAYLKLLDLNNPKEQLEGLQDLGWDHEQILTALNNNSVTSDLSGVMMDSPFTIAYVRKE